LIYLQGKRVFFLFCRGYYLFLANDILFKFRYNTLFVRS